MVATVCAQTNNPSAAERFARPSEVLVARENAYWRRIPLPVPEPIVLETSGIVMLPQKRLLVTTRRGEMWIIDGAFELNDPKPVFTLFASGLHEPLGVVAAPAGGFYVAQRQEVTRIEDTDGDGRADVFRNALASCRSPAAITSTRSVR